jgi:3-hydroxyisobutyrate dehydrogenase-like beta-hydroxyacid dehydrogenase
VTTIGLISPGEMGGAVGRCLVSAGHHVLWASEGRSAQTAERARACGLENCQSMSALAVSSAVIFSICPPGAAVELARGISGFSGTYVDANAISPMNAQKIGDAIKEGGGTFVDGGIIGPPPTSAGSTRLYLSGSSAKQVAALFAGTNLEARVVSARIGDASGLKMVYAAWTKGTSAMLIAIDDVAEALGVRGRLRTEWALSQPDLESRLGRARESAESKGWRWVAEMEEIAATFEANGIPGDFHHGAAEVFRRD